MPPDDYYKYSIPTDVLEKLIADVIDTNGNIEEKSKTWWDPGKLSATPSELKIRKYCAACDSVEYWAENDYICAKCRKG